MSQTGHCCGGPAHSNECAQHIFNSAFNRPRDPRSAEYKAGVLAALRYRIEGVKIKQVYRPGTASADAFYSGLDEGHRLWRE